MNMISKVEGSKFKVLVFTDRFPPYAEGGAEISLYASLSQIKKHFSVELIVAVLDENAFHFEESTHDEIKVYRIPYSSRWPVEFWENRHLSLKSPVIIWRQIHRLKSISDYFLSGLFTGTLIKRMSRCFFFRKIRKEKISNYFPISDEEIVSLSTTNELIKKIVADFSPDFVHADNFRSILLINQSIPKDIPWVAQVRDNRFFCSHPNQPTNVNGKVCSNCHYECLDHLQANISVRFKDYFARDRLYRQTALKKATHVIVTSEYLKSQISQIVDQSRISLVRNSVNELDLAKCAKSTVVQATPKEILIVGMINLNKGQLQVLNWIDKLNDALPDFRIIIAGRGDHVKNIIKKQSSFAKQSDKIVFTGYLSREELYRAYARASVVACPNVWPEPFGRVPLEAGLSSKPVVAYSVGGISENIIDKKTGLLVPERDEDTFVEALITLLKNPSYAEELGRNAFNHIVRNFNPNDSALKLLDVWINVINQKNKAM